VATLGLLMDALGRNPALHAPTGAQYRLWKAEAREIALGLFSAAERVERDFGPFGKLSMPYTKMGAIDSVDLFGLDELIIFSFYRANRNRYQRALDIGANLGLHSMIMSRCGFQVRAFEPDPWHFGLLKENLAANGAKSVEPIQAAVSTTDGEAQFVRVLGNTTGSHLAGSKDSYGDKETFKVEIRAAAPLFESADLAKIDAEGHEKEILLAASRAQLQKLDIMVEIGNAANAKAVFEHLRGLGVGMFAQKIGWQRVKALEEVPTSHREGSLFISAKAAMPWSGP
jgi:FkbM family methyltransferase